MFEPRLEPMIARDLVGYGEFPPDPAWPGGATVAVNFNLNVEGGGTMSADFFLDQAGGRWKGHVGRNGGQHDQVNLRGTDFGACHGAECRLGRQIGSVFIFGGDAALLRDPGSPGPS